VTTGIDALQTTLAAEHAAVFVFAALGGRASALPPSPMRSALDAAYAVHLERREQLRTMITADGGDPVASEAAYRLPTPLAVVRHHRDVLLSPASGERTWVSRAASAASSTGCRGRRRTAACPASAS